MPNKAQFIEQLAERFDGDKKRAAAALEAVLETVYKNVAKGEKVGITGFGIFEKRERAARIARNPATGAPVKLKKTSVPAFRPGAEFRAITSGAKKLAKAAPAKKAPAAKAAPAKKAAPVKKAVAAKVAPVKKAVAAKTAPVKKAVAAKAPVKKAAAKTLAKSTSAPVKKAAAKTLAKKTPAKKAAK